ncbi:MAG TPA: DUF3572 family protein [Rhizomicrobium sp.]|jgi:hypothetical protein
MPGRNAVPDNDILALEALAFLADSPDDLTAFMVVSGMDPASLRARAGEPEFLAGVLDYLLSEEKLLLRFCEARAVEPAALHRLHAVLSSRPNAAD